MEVSCFLAGNRLLLCKYHTKGKSKQILEASGKCAVSTLKLEAEAWYVKDLTLTMNNAIDELLYAWH